MKRCLVLIAVLVFLPTGVWARIGETLAQCEKRYGKAVRVDPKSGINFFRKGEFFIGVNFHQGKVDIITYLKVEKDVLETSKEISTNEIEMLLKANGGDNEWKKLNVLSMNRRWHTEDGFLVACYTTMENFLMICTKEYIEREEAKSKSKEKKALDGF